MSEPATVADVLATRAPWSAERGDAPAWLAGLPARSVSLVFFSPPYEGQRTYGIGFRRRGQVWVDWMRPIVREACRVSNGLVVVNMSSPVKDWSYSAAVEWLVADLTRLDGVVCGPRPYTWVKSQDDPDADGNGTPGSGGEHYQRSDWEPLYTFALPDRLPGVGRDFWSDNTAFGHPPRCGPGGGFSTRGVDGARCNDPWKTASRGGSNCGGRSKDGAKKSGPKQNSPGPSRRASGEQKAVKRGHTFRVPTADGDVMREQHYAPPILSNPGNVIRAPVGGGKLGHALAHRGEAPMSLFVAERFVCWFVPPGGIVCDPFGGTGTTLHAALAHGRRGIGCDVRQSQVDLTRLRLRGVTPTLFADSEPLA